MDQKRFGLTDESFVLAINIRNNIDLHARELLLLKLLLKLLLLEKSSRCEEMRTGLRRGWPSAKLES